MGVTFDREYTHVDRSGWGDGPWNDEPDKLQWVDEATGFDCLIVRNRLGALCGYVGLPPEHPCHGADNNSVKTEPDDEDDSTYPDVHGGLTYAAACQEQEDEAKGICHVPAPGRPGDVWWLGFDCAHSFDVAPGMLAREREMGLSTPRFPGESYKTVRYVQNECERLARQLVTANAEDTA